MDYNSRTAKLLPSLSSPLGSNRPDPLTSLFIIRGTRLVGERRARGRKAHVSWSGAKLHVRRMNSFLCCLMLIILSIGVGWLAITKMSNCRRERNRNPQGPQKIRYLGQNPTKNRYFKKNRTKENKIFLFS